MINKLLLFFLLTFSLPVFAKGILVAQCDLVNVEINNRHKGYMYVDVVTRAESYESELIVANKDLELGRVDIIFRNNDNDIITKYAGDDKLIGVMKATPYLGYYNGLTVKKEGAGSAVFKSTTETVMIKIPELGIDVGTKRPYHVFCVYP